MDRFILRYRGTGPLPDDTVRKVEQLTDTRILQRTSRMLLVEGTADALGALIGSQPDWLLVPERSYTLPDARPTPKRKE